MSISAVQTVLTRLADDLAYHFVVVAQGVMDMAVLLALGLAVYASGLSGPQPARAQVVTGQHQMSTNCAMALLPDSCITQSVLHPQDI